MPDHKQTQTNIYPCLYYDDAATTIEWLCTAFGFTKQFVVPGEGGAIEHAELSFGPGVIMGEFSEARQRMGQSPQLASSKSGSLRSD